jgi:Fe-Mn family superoxide dismutase
MTIYTLPDLEYDFGALEPHISGRIMELHHGKHHKGYVDGANAALDKLAAARESANFDAIVGLEKTLAFNLGGHINHTIFWENLSPDSSDRPDGELAAAIDEFFGSFEIFQKQFTSVSTTIQGSGWAVLAWDALAKQLVIFQVYDHQASIPAAMIPIVLLDVWEHAFYLDYVNVKADYVKAWWNIVNWQDAAARFKNATSAAGIIVP